MRIPLSLVVICFCGWVRAEPPPDSSGAQRRLLYVATPGIRNEVDRGGTGIAVFDIDSGHHFVRRIPVKGLGDEAHPQAARGICASAVTGRLYVSTPGGLSCLKLADDSLIWQRSYDAGCDRMSISPDGKWLFEPTFEGKYWHVLDAASGEELLKIPAGAGAHNTVYSRDGKQVYLASLHSPELIVTDAATRTPVLKVGPFSEAIRPFTVNSESTLCYVCVNKLLGFEIGDLKTGRKLYRVEVKGFQQGPTKRHGCPSHGIGLTPDEKEVWVVDAHNRQVHVFDNTVMPPRQLQSIAMAEEPGWVTFGIDGRNAYISTGEVVDVASHKVITRLKDENGRDVQSEKLLEIDFSGAIPTRAGDQFGIGRKTAGTGANLAE